jgi:hypothetical protein
MRVETRHLVCAVMAVALLPAACSDPAAPETDASLQVLAFTDGFDEVTASGGAPGSVLSVDIQRAFLVLGRLKLEKADGTASDFTDERSFVIELGTGGDPVLAMAADVPVGSYKEIELAIDKLERGHPTEQALINAFPRLDDASVLIEGTVTRAGSGPQTFSFASALDIDLELAFDPPLVIDSMQPGRVLLSLVLDASSWFRDSSTGELIDPAVGANRSRIEGAIQRSIELFEDSNRDGRP